MTEAARHVSLGIGGPLGAEPDLALVQTAFADELAAQLDLAEAAGLADLAHIVVAIEEGLIPEQPGRRLLALLLELQETAGRMEVGPERGDLYTNREAWLRERDPEAADWVGIGRARRETTTVAIRLVLRDQLIDLGTALIDLGGSLVRRAQEDGEEPFPDYTYLRVTQAGTWGHYLLGATQPTLRDLARIRDLWPRIDEGPVALGAGLGSRMPLDRRRVAAALGFARPVAHTRDATWQADVVLEAIGVATVSLLNQARLAEDLLIFSTQAFGLIDVTDSFSRASRALPQKRNPFGLTWIRGLASRAIGAQSAAAGAQRSATGMPDSRLEATRAAVATLRSAVAAARLLAAMVRNVRLDPEAIERRLREEDAAARDLAEALTERGVPWATAHRMVARLIRQLRAQGHSLSDGSSEAIRAALTTEGHDPGPGTTFADMTTLAHIEEALREVTEPRRAAEARRSEGATATECLDDLTSEALRAIARYEHWIDRRRRTIARSREQLLDRARRVASQGSG